MGPIASSEGCYEGIDVDQLVIESRSCQGR